MSKPKKSAFSVRVSGEVLIIELPLAGLPESSTRKSRIVASTGGFMPTDLEIDGEQVKVNATAIIKNKSKIRFTGE